MTYLVKRKFPATVPRIASDTENEKDKHCDGVELHLRVRVLVEVQFVDQFPPSHGLQSFDSVKNIHLINATFIFGFNLDRVRSKTVATLFVGD